ncbi:Histone deacetylase complex subunit SAP18 [Picochlorum sp. SENEW3]|nr:Histone deacetylase complex subunit SAP18 [Picochlorum sp. SENEW3]WPT15617.1 Histone deacetylase complex subunit SAP18 [Picochlorum sp. SENEW3]
MGPQPRGRGPVHFNREEGGNFRRSSYSPVRRDDGYRRSNYSNYSSRPRGRRSFPPRSGGGNFGRRSSGYGGRMGGTWKPKSRISIDRKSVCPLLLRVFPRDGSVKREPEEYSQYCRVTVQDGEIVPQAQGKLLPEFRIYTWKDATLKELYELVQKTVKDERGDEELPDQGFEMTDATTMSFSLVYPDSRGRLVMRSIGKVSGSADEKESKETLQDVGFQIGDIVDVVCG